MKFNRNFPRKVFVLQILTLTFMIFLLPIYIYWFGFRFAEGLTLFFMIYLFLPNFVGWIYKLSHDEIKYPIIAVLAIIWMFLLFNSSHIIEYVYGKYLGIHVYFFSLVPAAILIFYLTYYGEWENFYKSLSRMHLEDHIKKKSKEIVENIELEFGEIHSE